MEAANEVGVNLKQGYNGDLTAREVGSVGGQMVKKMIDAYKTSHAEKCSYESYFSLHSFHTPSIAIITMELYEIFENASTSNSLIVKFRNKTLLRRLPLLDKTVFNPYIDCKINNLIIFPIRDLTV